MAPPPFVFLIAMFLFLLALITIIFVFVIFLVAAVTLVFALLIAIGIAVMIGICGASIGVRFRRGSSSAAVAEALGVPAAGSSQAVGTVRRVDVGGRRFDVPGFDGLVDPIDNSPR